MSQQPNKTQSSDDARIVIDLDSEHPSLQPVLKRLNPLLQEILGAMKTTTEASEPALTPYDQPGVFHRIVFSSCPDF